MSAHASAMDERQEAMLGAIACAQLSIMRGLRDLASAVESGQYVPQASCRPHARAVRDEMRRSIDSLSAAMIECEADS